jgi:hypothetical protein
MGKYNNENNILITDVWQMKQSDIIDEIRRNGNKVKLGGEARCCSPGHTALFI